MICASEMTIPIAFSVPTVLMLGGTWEGRVLAMALGERFRGLRVITSLAGETARLPPPWRGLWRAGPFGGVEGLTAYLRGEGVAVVLVATHPFAATIARNARLACETCGVPRLTLSRPLWTHTLADRWIEVDSMMEAAKRLPDLGRRAFLTIGVRALPVFATGGKVWFLVRLPQNTPLPFPPHEPPHRLVIGSGDGGSDLALMRTHAIDVLVTKASGGAATEGKIIAARMLGLPVLMVRRPAAEPGERVATVTAAVAWVEAAVADSRTDASPLDDTEGDA